MSTCTDSYRWDGVKLTDAQKSITAVSHANGQFVPKEYGRYVEPTATITWQTNPNRPEECQVSRIDLELFLVVCPRTSHAVTAALSMYAGSERVEVWDGVHVSIDRDAQPKRKVQVCSILGKPGTVNVELSLNHAAYYSAIGVDTVRLYYRGGWGSPVSADYLEDSAQTETQRIQSKKMDEELAAWIRSGKLDLIQWNPSWEMDPSNDAWRSPEHASLECAGDGPAYLDCLYMAKGSADWLGIVQQDEFWHPQEPVDKLLASIPSDIENLMYTLYEWNATSMNGVSNYFAAGSFFRSRELGAEEDNAQWGFIVRPRSATSVGAQAATLSNETALGRYLDPFKEFVVEHFTWHPNVEISRKFTVNISAVPNKEVVYQAKVVEKTEAGNSHPIVWEPHTQWKKEWAAKVAQVRNEIRHRHM